MLTTDSGYVEDIILIVGPNVSGVKYESFLVIVSLLKGVPACKHSAWNVRTGYLFQDSDS